MDIRAYRPGRIAVQSGSGTDRIWTVRAGLAGLILLSLAAVSGNAAAQGTYGQSDPCLPPQPNGDPFDGLTAALTASSRRQACLEERRAQWTEYYARQKALNERQAADAQAARDRQAADDARSASNEAAAREQAARDAASADQAAQDAASADLTRRTAHAAMLRAEHSPHNRCRAPDVVRGLIAGWNGLSEFKSRNMVAIDVEHLVTASYDERAAAMRCHGVFVTDGGSRLVGTLSVKDNVVGDTIFAWQSDDVQDLSIYAPEPAPGPAASEPGQDGAPSFSAGLQARRTWEAWVAGLSGSKKEGAIWWAANRNGPTSASCANAPGSADSDWSAGCLDAQRRLTQVDSRRSAEVSFRKGWNSL